MGHRFRVAVWIVVLASGAVALGALAIEAWQAKGHVDTLAVWSPIALLAMASLALVWEVRRGSDRQRS